MIITEGTDIYIYGYGVRGNAIRQTLQKRGLKVVAFIDRNAEKYAGENTDIPVWSLQKLSHFSVDFSNAVVIVAVSNIFEHEKIANTLASVGFRYIICKLLGSDGEDKTCSRLYDKTVDYLEQTSIRCEEVLPFQNKKTKKTGKRLPLFILQFPLKCCLV